MQKIKSKLWDFIKSLFFSGPSFVGMLIFFIIPFGVVVRVQLSR